MESGTYFKYITLCLSERKRTALVTAFLKRQIIASSVQDQLFFTLWSFSHSFSKGLYHSLKSPFLTSVASFRHAPFGLLCFVHNQLFLSVFLGKGAEVLLPTLGTFSHWFSTRVNSMSGQVRMEQYRLNWLFHYRMRIHLLCMCVWMQNLYGKPQYVTDKKHLLLLPNEVSHSVLYGNFIFYSSHNDFLRDLHRCLDEEGIVSNIVTLFDFFMWNELWITKA